VRTPGRRLAGRVGNEQRTGRGYDAASAVVWFIGISQGVVPLAVRSFFDRDGRFALPLLLPEPWWWLTCVAVIVGAAVGLVLIDAAKERQAPEERAGPPEDGEAPASGKTGADGYDALSGVVLLAGIYNGLVPFVVRLFSDGELLLAFTLRLPAPWWWLASLAVLVLTAVLLMWIETAKERSTGTS
jgi:hypothetical protein